MLEHPLLHQYHIQKEHNLLSGINKNNINQAHPKHYLPKVFGFDFIEVDRAKVGFFLESNREQLMVDDYYLDKLKKLSPSQPRYLDSSREPGKLITRWNLIVPERILLRTWEDVI